MCRADTESSEGYHGTISEDSHPSATISAFDRPGRSRRLIGSFPFFSITDLNDCLLAFQISHFSYLPLCVKALPFQAEDLRTQEEFLSSTQTGRGMLTAFFLSFFFYFASKEGTVKSRTWRLIPAICRNV